MHIYIQVYVCDGHIYICYYATDVAILPTTVGYHWDRIVDIYIYSGI